MAEEKGPDITSILIILGVIILAAAVVFMGPDFGTMIANLQAAGFYSYILPFALIFAVVFAVLKGTKIVDDMTAFIIALVVALFSMLFLSTVPIVGFLAFFFGRIGIVIVILLVIYMFYAYMSRGEEKKK
jgi:hypothetical protein